MESIRILIADDHSIIRAGIRSLLLTIPGVEIVGEASDGLQALELVSTLRPQLLLTDIKMPQMNGLMLTERISIEFPEVRVIILSMYSDEEFVTKAIRSKAAGYILKDSKNDEFEFAIKSVLQGKFYVSASISHRLAKKTYEKESHTDAPALSPLTLRQQEILRMVAEGASTKIIAKTLAISPKTVETHRAHIMERLEIYDVPSLVRYAMRVGLIPVETPGTFPMPDVSDSYCA